MSAPRTPTKSGGSKGDDAKTPRPAGSAAPRPAGSAAPRSPPTGSAQRRSAAGSQVGSPAVRSGAASAASPSGLRDKLNSAANKQAAASPIPGQQTFTQKLFNLLDWFFFSCQISD